MFTITTVKSTGVNYSFDSQTEINEIYKKYDKIIF